MEIKEWRSLAIQSVSLFLVVMICCVSFAGRIQQKPLETVMAEEKKEQFEEDTEVEQEEVEKVENATKAQVESRSDAYIRIPKTELIADAEIVIRNEYMGTKIEIAFHGVPTGSVTKDSILRIHGFEVDKGPARKKETLIKKLVINDDKKTLASENVIRVDMLTKKLYEPTLFEADDAYYISLVEPKEAFDKIVVIDAGHGGMDEGTSSQDGRHVEKDYTLLVVKKLKKLLDQENIKVYYTRLEDIGVSKTDRTKLANRLRADLFVSIHCNASSVGDTTAYGLETLYSKRKLDKSQISNKRLAQIILNTMADVTGFRNRGIIQREQLYLLHHADVPTTIVEIGYMSNKNDLKYITKESGQQKIAQGIYEGIMKALDEK